MVVERDAFPVGGYGTSPYVALAHRAAATGAQSLTSGVRTILVADVEDYDPSGSYNPSTGEFTCPVAGVYAMWCSIDFEVSSSDPLGSIYQIGGVHNGSVTTFAHFVRHRIVVVPTAGSPAYTMAVGAVVYSPLCAAGDVLSIQGFQNTGGARNFDGAFDTTMMVGFALLT